MAKIRFKNGIVEDYTIVLSTRDYRHQGHITGIRSDTVEYAANLSSANEFSFTVCKFDMIKDRDFLSDEEYKRYCEEMELMWDRIVDFKLIWVKELDEYYEIKVSVEDAAETIKTITATSLCECELSNLIIDNLEINTEADIEIQSDDYEGTVFCNAEHPEISLLHRVIADKAPHYYIKHVDESLMNEIRIFSVSGTSIYDFLTGDVAEQFNCIFIFDSKDRSISVYDLYTVCKDCGYREEFFEEDEETHVMKCPKCGSENIKYFGEDTTIYIDKTNLTDSIRLETNKDEVKNCLKLEAGDDLMTSTIQMLNPNGSNYLYRITEFQREDMPESLVEKLDEYDVACASYAEEHEDLVEQFYQLTDDILYLEHGMMPTINTVDKFEDVGNPRPGVLYVKDGKTYVHNGEEFVLQDDIDAEFYTNLIPKADAITAGSEAAKLTVENLNEFGVTSITKNTLVGTINTSLKNYAKIFVKSGYVKIDVATVDKDNNPLTNEFVAEMTTDEEGKEVCTGKGIWKGHFIVTSYSNEDDVVITDMLTLEVHEDYEKFLKQKVLKDIALNNNDDEGTIFDVLEIDDLENFKNALTLYGVKRLESFYDATQGALDILVQAEQSSESAVLYESFYLPYYNKLTACQAELNKRNSELNVKEEELDKVDARLTEIHDALDFRTYLGEENYKIFCAYRREDTYSNENYISEGSEENSSKLIADAKLFLKSANQELIRVSEPQITITSSLKNFLVIPQFKPLLDYFELGNWIRIKVDGVLYDKVRLIGYNISFGSLQEIGVQFSSVTKEKNVVNDAKEIIQSAKSMAGSFGYVSKQAEKGSSAKDNINDITKNGLDSGLIQIKNNQNEEITYGKHGILCRSLDDLTGDYSPEQLKITHNIMAYTDDNWATVKQAMGKHSYRKYDEEKVNEDGTKGGFVDSVGYGLNSEFVTAGIVTGSQIVGGDIYSTNYPRTWNEEYEKYESTGSYINLIDGTFSFGGGSLTFEDGILSINSPDVATKNEVTEIQNNIPTHVSQLVNDNGYQTTTGVTNIIGGTVTTDFINALNVTAGSVAAENISGTTITGKTISGGSISIGNNFSVDQDGVLQASGANITGVINAVKGGTIAGFTIDENAIYKGTNSLTSTASGIYIGTNGIRQYASSNANVTISNGILNANGANISGKITATSGTIGAIDIVSTKNSSLNAYGNSLCTSTTVTMPVSTVINSSTGATDFVNTSSSIQGGLKTVYGSSELVFYIKAKPSATTTWDGANDGNLFYVRADGYTSTRGLRVATPFDLESKTVNGAVRYGNSDDYYIKTVHSQESGDYYMRLNHVKFNECGVISSITPADDNNYNLGTSDHRWNQLYAKKSTSVSSDRNFKKDITPLTDSHKQFFMKLIPVSYMFTEPSSDRTHIGFIAQDVEQAMEECGLTSLDFAGLCKDIKRERVSDNKYDKRMRDVLDENGNPVYVYSLRYTEFIGIITHVLQDTVSRLDKLESLVTQLKSQN